MIALSAFRFSLGFPDLPTAPNYKLVSPSGIEMWHLPYSQGLWFHAARLVVKVDAPRHRYRRWPCGVNSPLPDRPSLLAPLTAGTGVGNRLQLPTDILQQA